MLHTNGPVLEEIMPKPSMNNKRKLRIASIITVLVLTVLIGACAIYLGDYYRADMDAIQAFLPADTRWEESPEGTIVFAPDNAVRGFIFYPGGKVEYTAYIPLLQALSEQGVLTVLVEMPFHLAVLDVNAAYRRCTRKSRIGT